MYRGHKLSHSNTFMQISCPDDYRQWLVSMFSLFGTKLYSGPMWRVETMSQEQQVSLSSTKLPVEVYYTILYVYTACANTCISPCDLSSLQQARTNVPELSERTLQRDIASSGILTGAGIQVGCVLIFMSVQFSCCYQQVCSLI